MPTGGRLFATATAVVGCLAITSFSPATSVGSLLYAAPALPDKLGDREFWLLTEELSESTGTFPAENFLSNERGYQLVMPDLIARAKAGGVYLGVGPEQNFSYIAALRSRLAFIIDIRRGNLLEHLLYKALFELSSDRADFLSRLFSRKRPAGLTRKSTAAELFAAYEPAEPTDALYRQNLQAVVNCLTRKHHFALSDEDLQGIENIYHHAFYTGGPNLTYAMGGGDGGSPPTYRELMQADDGTGLNRGYLANEENFAVLKNLESRNLLVPVVGNFGGPKAIRAISMYLKVHGGMVSAFYVSNVEQYLIQDGSWMTFCMNVATLPLEEASTYIYTGAGGPAAFRDPRPDTNGPFDRFRSVTGGLQTSIRPIQSETKRCAPAPSASSKSAGSIN